MFMKMVVLTRKQLKKTKQGRTNRWVINSNLNSWRACKSNFKIWWILWKIYLVESELEVSKNCTKPLSKQTEKLQITKKYFGFSAIPSKRNGRDKSSTWKYPRHTAWRINMPSFVPYWCSCFAWWSWHLSQNEAKRLDDSQVLQQKKKK